MARRQHIWRWPNFFAEKRLLTCPFLCQKSRQDTRPSFPTNLVSPGRCITSKSGRFCSCDRGSQAFFFFLEARNKNGEPGGWQKFDKTDGKGEVLPDFLVIYSLSAGMLKIFQVLHENSIRVILPRNWHIISKLGFLAENLQTRSNNGVTQKFDCLPQISTFSLSRKIFYHGILDF